MREDDEKEKREDEREWTLDQPQPVHLTRTPHHLPLSSPSPLHGTQSEGNCGLLHTRTTAMQGLLETFLLYMLIIVLSAGALKGLVEDEKENIARGKPTTLTSGNTSELAIDGDPNTYALSQVDSSPTWRVDLERVYQVETVSITNRIDCCPEKLNGAQIHIGSANSANPRCAVVSMVPPGETYTYSCHGMEGRLVSIFVPGPGQQLALAEVQVFGRPADNLALLGAVSQSSTFSTPQGQALGPQLSHDGDRSTSDPALCSRTQEERSPWWRLDLGEEHQVSTVTILTRADLRPEPITQGGEIRVGSSLDNNGNDNAICASVSSKVPQFNTYVCDGMVGRYVNIHLPGEATFINLCEVEVTGSPLVLPTTTPVPAVTPPPPITITLPGDSRTVVLVHQQLSWFDALLHCRSFYRDLLTLRDPEEQRYIEDNLLNTAASTTTTTTHMWLGLRRRMLSTHWYWMNGEGMGHSSWEGGHPRYHETPGTSTCGAIATRGQHLWSDQPCEEKLFFLCYSDSYLYYSPVQFAISRRR
ncbi:uncharacterized protein LOC134437076 [Engraulis encrasicolus]|uniref:uncharacterized protein LOC134437076 n=1 Tax=Engraulis encrasicolus TaxID=184585 RepID=UPI002FD3FB64